MPVKIEKLLLEVKNISKGWVYLSSVLVQTYLIILSHDSLEIQFPVIEGQYYDIFSIWGALFMLG